MVDFEVIGFGFWPVVSNIQILAYCSQYTELWVESLTDGSSNGGHGNGGRWKGLPAMEGNSNGCWQQLDSDGRLNGRDSRQRHIQICNHFANNLRWGVTYQ
jgi:hypothetical protein